MKTYLVEKYSPDIKFDSNSLIIALTPRVCYQLDKEGIGYSIIEDYYDEVELSNQVDDYRQSVFRWIDRLDNFLQANVKGLDLKLGAIYAWYLKRMIIDTLYVRCYTLKRLFEGVKPSEITFIAARPEEPNLNYRFEHYGRSLYAQVIPILCGESSIPLTPVFLEPDSQEAQGIRTRLARQDANIITRLKLLLGKWGMVSRLYFIYKCSKKLPFARQARREKLNIFMLKTGYGGEEFIIDGLARGHNIYLLSGDFITKYSYLGETRYLDLKAESDKVTSLNNGLWEYTANLLDGHDLIRWVNEKCQLDVSEIVIPKLRHFVLKVCPEIIRYFRVFTEFYERERIDILFTPSISPLSEYAALAAANNHPQVKTACLRHGEAVYDDKTWYTTELQNFDIHISSHTEAKEYYINLAKAINSPARIYSSPHRLLNTKRTGYLREKRKSNTIRRNRIIYLTGFMMWDTRRMNSLDYPDTWYYKLQKSLIEYFSTRRAYTFVWKGLPQAEEIYNPIPDFIIDSNFSNIEVATNPFTQHLLSADRVICDYPSTGFYESVIAGVPVMSLYPKALIMRKTAVEYFGNLLKLFSDIPEAIKHVDEFLNSDPELYKATIDMEDNSLLDILEEN
ncbi:hypothetical protein ACFLXT_00665 [Chloroflexota bacterium]